MEKLETFTNNEFRFMIIWKTRKMQSIFKLKDKNLLIKVDEFQIGKMQTSSL